MSRFIMLEADSKNNPLIGKFEMPIKMIIEEESNQWEKDKLITKALYNVEKSNQFAETVIGESGFDLFEETEEGNGAPNDTVGLTAPKTIYHHEFKKEFTVSEKMVEDANWGLPAEAGRRARDFVRAWYTTQNKIAEQALFGATKATTNIVNGTFDLKTSDDLPLFSTGHTFTSSKKNRAAKGTQSNYFKHALDSVDAVKNALEAVTLKMRAFKDENGESLGYTPDTIIIPGTQHLEFMIKELLGSDHVPGKLNAINTQYGNWNLVVLPHWDAPAPAMMVMSSDANKTLRGNMFYERAPLKINNWVDKHTGNYIWNGRGRYGLGFGTWKHIAFIGDTTNHDTATELK